VPSKHAKEKAIKYKVHNRLKPPKICPLLLDIDSEVEKNKNRFLFIGRIHKAKSFDSVLNILKSNDEIIIEVITTSDISHYLSNGFKDYVDQKRLIVESNQNISEEVIQGAIKKATAVFKLDTLMTQSGVVPLCFSLSTPVIARDIIGFSQDISHMKNGFLVNESTPEQINEAINWVNQNLEVASKNARAEYERKFSINTWNKTWGALLSE
jgi:glycosyltransferase involved in cell wall biosynthesis